MEMAVSDKITLVVRFRIEESAKLEFTAKLQDVFAHIVKEETFVEASLVQDMRDPQSILASVSACQSNHFSWITAHKIS